MTPDEALVRRILGGVMDEHTDRPLADVARAIGVDGNKVSVDIQLGYPAAGVIGQLTQRVRDALEADPAIESAAVSISSRIHVHKVQGALGPLPSVKNIIVVASGKGGVGKSTVAANLALALLAEGAKVGVMDADIYGPSQPTMLGVHGKPASPDGKSIMPMHAHGMPVMSIGFLVEEDTPMIWRGPMVTQAMMQLLGDTRWEQLDYLVVDLPPGTGDIQLTLAQKVPVSGAVIVTTPQDIALLDARKALKMFEKVEVPVLGVVENMATHICSVCGTEEHIFGEGGGARMSAQYNVPYLGSLPLDIRIREQTDSGRPTVVAMPDSEIAARYRAIARNTAGRLSLQPRNKSLGFSKVSVEGLPSV
ncbi:MAG: iron-sulfur cluster carrier protein ApbC [Rhodanobacter sp.]